MSLLGNLLGAVRSSAARDSGQSAQRMAEWERALESGGLPSFVQARLADAAAAKAPWVATLTAAELGIVRARGIRPLAAVSGTCWLHYGYSWTRGHAEGWRQALTRLQREARAVGANAVVDVRMRTIKLAVGESMDFTLIGTAVRIEGLPAGAHPIVATVPALEFVRLLEAGIAPVGIAIGAHYAFLGANMLLAGLVPVTGGTDPMQFAVQRLQGGRGPGALLGVQVKALRSTGGRRSLGTNVLGSNRPFTSMPLPELSHFWEGIRRRALVELQCDAAQQGNGVLAHSHFGQLLRVESGNNNPPRILGRHIVIGTVVDTRRAATVPHTVGTVVDMHDGASPLSNAPVTTNDAYPVREQEGAV